MPTESGTTETETQGGVTEGSPRPAGVGPEAELPVFVVDDHQVVLDAVAAVIMATPGLTLAGTAVSGSDALRRIATLAGTPVLLVDVNLGRDDGVEVARRYVVEHGGAAVLMSARSETDLPAEWSRGGAAAFVPKDQIGSGRLEAALWSAAQPDSAAR